jgi:UPF0716 family protein affecting phage T7 exclusion
MLTLMKGWERALCAIGALCLIAPGLKISLLGVAFMLPVLIHQWTTSQSRKGASLA